MLTIGVTGHRFLANVDRIIAGVDEALGRIEEAWPGESWAVISSLAEGADRLVAYRAIGRLGAKLLVTTPLQRADYLTDFETTESKQEFLRLVDKAGEIIELPPRATRDEAYAAAGRYVLDHCDVLIAVWDGQEAQGRGGTGETVAQARQRGLPLVWVHAGNRKPGTHEPTTLQEEQGTVTFERLPKRPLPTAADARRANEVDTPSPYESKKRIGTYLGPPTPWQKRFQQFWRDWRWPLLLVTALLSLALGYVGFAKSAAARGDQLSRTDLLYLTLQLIAMESGMNSRPVTLELEIARLLIPALTAYTALAALALIFREQAQILRLRFVRDHIIIAGLGRKGFLLARHFLELGRKVVVLEADEANPLLEQCRELGAITLIGDASDPDLLRRAAVHRGKFLISICGDDGTNAEVAVQARQLIDHRGKRILTCIIYIVDPKLWSLLRKREIGSVEFSGFRLELFSVFDRGARALLREFPPFDGMRGLPSCPPHLLVIGLGGMGESLVVQAARRWWDQHPPANQRLRITVVDREADWKAESLRVRYPQLPKVCDLIPCQMDVHSPAFERAEFLYDADGRCDVEMVYICLDNDSLGLHTGLTLQHRMTEHRIPIVVRMCEDAGLATLLPGRRAGKIAHENLYAFGLLDRTCTMDLVLGGTHEILARAIHDEYVRHQQERGETAATNPRMIPWDELPRHFRESNRRQVDHIGLKLKAVSCDIAPLTDWDAASFRFTPEEIEIMAEMEHARWAEGLGLDGWTYAEGPQDPAAKTHPDLLPWEVLPEAEKEKNRNAVREMPGFLARAGFQVYRLQQRGEGHGG